MKERTLTYILVGLFLVISSLMLFPHLDSLPIRQWDEARLAVSALEMHESHNPIVVTFNGKPDLWNTKPPLAIWLQSLAMYVFGKSTLAVRLPSVLAMLTLGLVLIWFGYKIRRPYLGFFASLITYSSWQIIFWHCGRTGEYDAILLLFIVLYCIFFWLYTQDTSQKKYLIYFFIFLTLAALTKDIQAFVLMPGLLIYLIATKNLKTTLRSKQLWIGCMILLIGFGGYILLREIAEGGYISAMIYNNITGRYGEALDGNNAWRVNYLDHLLNHSFKAFFALVPFAFIFNLYNENKHLKSLSVYSFCLALSYLIIASFAKTRWEWYIYPVIPLLSIVIAISFDSIGNLIFLRTTKTYRTLCFIILCLLVFYGPLSNNILGDNGSFRTYEKGDLVTYNACMKIYKDIDEGKIHLPSSSLYTLGDEWRQDALYYTNLLKDKGINVILVEGDSLPKSAVVFIYYKNSMQKIDELYKYEDIYQYNDSHIIRILDKKQ